MSAVPAGTFSDRSVIVTGAAGQVGGECVRAFVGADARVAGIDLTAADLPGALALEADLSDAGDLERAFAAAEAEIGPVDVLVQSAAVMARVPLLEISAENIDHVFGVNVRAVLLGARRAAQSLMARDARDGVIVNLTSVAGLVSDGRSVVYEASKGAVTMATRSLAAALAPAGIRVVAVGPGSLAKPQEAGARDPLALDDYERRRIPLGRFGTGAEMARAVLFVASPAAGYMTGSTLYVDGGLLAAW
jgi:glucose 1-dehydrogenase